MTRLQLLGEITVEGAMPLFAAIRAARDDTIELTIDSGGGNALCAMALFELLVTHPHRVVADIKHASSGAALVAMGADLRRIAPGGKIMLHETHADLANATADVLRSTLADLELFDGIAAGILAGATGQTLDQTAAWRRSAMKFDAHEAIAAGLAHEAEAPEAQ